MLDEAEHDHIFEAGFGTYSTYLYLMPSLIVGYIVDESLQPAAAFCVTAKLDEPVQDGLYDVDVESEGKPSLHSNLCELFILHMLIIIVMCR